MVRSYDDWRRPQLSGWPAWTTATCGYRRRRDSASATRWAHHQEGYVPIGFFQLWHSHADSWRGARIKPYPSAHNDACRSDVQHGLQWDRRRRELVPEMLVVHLESENSANGVNWAGRKSKPFGPGQESSSSSSPAMPS